MRTNQDLQDKFMAGGEKEGDETQNRQSQEQQSKDGKTRYHP